MKQQVTDLLTSLVAIPSVSHNESKIIRFISRYFKQKSIKVVVSGRNLYVVTGKPTGKNPKTILLNSHVDTVPECPGWNTNPWKPFLRRGRLYGLGSNDAKSSICAMMLAIERLQDIPGRVIFAATCDEETGGEGLEVLLGELPRIDAAIIGEPTNLDICPGQRGLVVLKVNVKGKSGHASRPQEGINAIYKACEDITALQKMLFTKKDPVLGYPTLQVTLINGGTRHNVIPGACEFSIDSRTTSVYDNRKIIAMVKKSLKGRVLVHSLRLKPKVTALSSDIVRAASSANPQADIRAFAGVSDMVFIKGQAIVMGPGTSNQSHQANESVSLASVQRAVAVYERTIRAFI